MTDREQIIAAAKACGVELSYWCPTNNAFWCGKYWNPLTDDGDALRLEVALNLTSAWEPMRHWWSIGGIIDDEFKWLAFDEDRKRAIVKAAARIGKAMK